MRYLQYLLLITCIATFASSSTITIDPDTKLFMDSNNRVLLFHGVNVVYKLPPYYPPNLTIFDPMNSLCEQDYLNLRSWGFNFFRLYMSWEGTEVTRGSYNNSYVQQVLNITRTAAQYNITVLLDAHQDLLSRKFCGEGFPDWAVNHTNFPVPENVTLDFDSDGYPNITQCLEIGFFTYYQSENIQEALEGFYTNANGTQDSFAAYWQYIASVFKDEPNVIGYELMNEPYITNIYTDPNVKDFPEEVDLKYLQPMYKVIHDSIREVDNNTIIFFEPTINDYLVVGFTEGPGGPGYNSKQAFSYHVYCGKTNSSGDPINPEVCHNIDTLESDSKSNAADRLGVAAFMTEFGAVANDSASVEEISFVTGLADERLHGWAYWQFKYYADITTQASTDGFYDSDGELASAKVKALARTYFYAICGTPTKQVFDPTTGDFEFDLKPSTDCNGLNSEMFMSEEFYYPSGFEVSFDGCNSCSLVSLGNPGYYELVLGENYTDSVTVKISVKQSITY